MKLFHGLLLICFACSPIRAQYEADDWKDRDEWMDVNNILSVAGVEEGHLVADIGCHEGYMSMHLARRVGDSGKVYAVDIRADRLRTLEQHAEKRQLTNIKTIKGDYDNPNLPEKTLDVVLIMDTYHEISDYMTVLEHVKRSLKPNGRLIVIEKLKSHAKDKSRSAQTSAHTLSPHYVREELEEAGFEIMLERRNIGNWENNRSKKIWLLLAANPDA